MSIPTINPPLLTLSMKELPVPNLIPAAIILTFPSRVNSVSILIVFIEGDISVYSNKNLLQLSDQIFDITHIRLNKRILIRLLQDSNSNIPTLQTLDVVSRFLGYYS